MTGITYICPHCGSEHLHFNASSTWDRDRQAFVHGSTCGGGWCKGCGKTFSSIQTRSKPVTILVPQMQSVWSAVPR